MIKGLMRKIMTPAVSLRLSFVATLRSSFTSTFDNISRSVRGDKRSGKRIGSLVSLRSQREMILNKRD